MVDKPAALGGSPVFESPLPFARPTFEEGSVAAAMQDIEASLTSGVLTDGPQVRRLEEQVAAAWGVGDCVAVSSATTGLTLLIQALDAAATVLVPSFTFSATAHAVRWNGLDVAFADCDAATWCLRPDDVWGTPEVIVGVHVSGVPCDVLGLEKHAADLGARLVFDAAHGAGSLASIDGVLRPLGGFGVAEVFSLTPTKVMSGAEGGLITTDDAALGEHLRTARNYGNPGDYDTRFAGTNARLSELHATLALLSLHHLEERVAARNAVADRYRELLGQLPGIGFQEVPNGSLSSYKDFTITVDSEPFGAGRDAVDDALHAEGVQTRRYYSPPVHQQSAYADVELRRLPITEQLGETVISLPIWSHLPLEDVERVGGAFTKIRAHAGAVAAAWYEKTGR